MWGVSITSPGGLIKYGFEKDAHTILYAFKTVRLFGRDFERFFGVLNEYYQPDAGEPVSSTRVPELE